MSTRTTESLVTFSHPFMLRGLEKQQAAGTYRVVVDEEEILGLSFLAYQRTSTMLHSPAVSAKSGSHQVYEIDPNELATALEADAQS